MCVFRGIFHAVSVAVDLAVAVAVAVAVTIDVTRVDKEHVNNCSGDRNNNSLNEQAVLGLKMPVHSLMAKLSYHHVDLRGMGKEYCLGFPDFGGFNFSIPNLCRIWRIFIKFYYRRHDFFEKNVQLDWP